MIRISRKALLIASLMLVVLLIGVFLGGFVAYLLYPASSLQRVPRPFEAPRVTALEGAKAPVPPPLTGYEAGGKSGGQTRETGSWMATLGRMVIVEGRVKIRVERGQIESAAEKIASIAVNLGGYVAQMNLYEDRVYIVIKVPVEKFEDAIKMVREVGEVVEVSTSASDVTEEYVDLNARLNALRRVEERLLSLLDKAQTVEEILKVEDYLRNIRVEIERIEAQLKYLERRVEYSTIRVEIESPPKQVKPMVVFPSFNPLPAVAAGLAAMYSVIYLLITVIIAILPLIAIGIPIYILYKKRSSKKEEE